LAPIADGVNAFAPIADGVTALAPVDALTAPITALAPIDALTAPVTALAPVNALDGITGVAAPVFAPLGGVDAGVNPIVSLLDPVVGANAPITTAPITALAPIADGVT